MGGRRHRTELELFEFFPTSWRVVESGCWIWTGSISPEGYARWCRCYVHRLAVLRSGRAIPKRWDVDHLCRNRPCVNPDHLDVVTHAENVRRGISGEVTRARLLAKTHCAQGHEFTPENTRQGARQRHCRTCDRNYNATRAARLEPSR